MENKPMSNNSLTYTPQIDLTLWPRGHELEGQRIAPGTFPWPYQNTHIRLEVADAELLLAFYRRCTKPYETAAAAALTEALEQYRIRINMEDELERNTI